MFGATCLTVYQRKILQTRTKNDNLIGLDQNKLAGEILSRAFTFQDGDIVERRIEVLDLDKKCLW